MLRKRVILKTLVVTRKKAPKFVNKVAKSVAISAAAEVFLHHRPPDGSVVIDVTFIEGLMILLK